MQVSPSPPHGTAKGAGLGLMAAFCSSHSNRTPGKLLLAKR